MPSRSSFFKQSNRSNRQRNHSSSNNQKNSVCYTGGSLCDHSRKTAAVRSAASQKQICPQGKRRRQDRVARQNCSPHGIQSGDSSSLRQRSVGNTIELQLSGSKCQFVIKDTGHFQNFKAKQVGTVQVARAGECPLKIRTIMQAKRAACDIRQIRLLPVKK